jgi:uncharacterized NAD-dependent epimerase/dehydratase family protein
MGQPVIQINYPFVVFLGDITDETYAKTGLGLVQWRRDGCVGQLRLPGSGVDAGVPDLTVSQAVAVGARSLIVGSAAVGGRVAPGWIPTLLDAAENGIDIVAGLHIRLASLPGLEAAAARGKARLIDVRVPPADLPVGTGEKRAGKRLLTVGTDCACGKKYTALALDLEMRRRGLKSDFRATGQTGIMIAGQGIPIDAVVSDFVTGAAELLSPQNEPDHWDIVEGQGALFHPGYLQVTVGLLVGSQPDAFVVCHDARRTHVSGWPEFKLPTLQQLIDRTIDLGRLTNPAIRCVGVAVNTSKVPPAEREAVLRRHARETGLPCVDPIIDGVGPIVDRMLKDFPA